jgi:hypothetical protein
VAKPLRWNTPAFVWNAPGVVWNGVEETTKSKMPKVKAVVDFTGYTAPELTPIATMIHDKMLANVAIFVTPAVTMAALQTTIDDYAAKLTARESGADADEIAFTVARHELEADLAELGHYVNGLAKGDPVIVDASGFPSYGTVRTPDYSAPAAPTNVRLRQGDVSRQIIMRFQPDRQKSMNGCSSAWPTRTWRRTGHASACSAAAKRNRAATPPAPPSGCAPAPVASKASWGPGATRRRSWWYEGE